jgi:hypothetical protein
MLCKRPILSTRGCLAPRRSKQKEFNLCAQLAIARVIAIG